MEKICYFCQENMDTVDFKNSDLLRQFLSGQKRILPPHRTGVCSRHQRMLARAVKRARFMALLPFITR